MKLDAFRINNFRSIIDTQWCNFSADGITVLIGQNESGKSSILDALSKTFGPHSLSIDDVRFRAPLPEINIRVTVTEAELRAALTKYGKEAVELALVHFSASKYQVEFRFYWVKQPDNPEKFNGFYALVGDAPASLIKTIQAKAKARADTIAAGSALVAAIATVAEQIAAPTAGPAAAPAPAPAAAPVAAAVPPSPPAAKPPILDTRELASAVHGIAPVFVLFTAESGTLPGYIDIGDKHELSGTGAAGASNFLAVAGIDLKTLVENDVRGRAMLLKRANDSITRDFLDFWKQTIGENNRLALECDIRVHGTDAGADKAGKAYLVFYISDGYDKLYPHQRSKGVSWFVSFYLQLKASEKAKRRFFLLDEPGANLHSKAQGDVLKLINKIRDNIDLIYSTHSAHLIEFEKLHRILAVQREKVDEDSPTVVISAHKLGAASRDTLSALLNAMGIDLSHQQVIRKRNNVLLEEISGFYYLKAFWKLTNSPQEVQFIPASGVSNIPTYVNCFLGWGLDFSVVVDDEPHGRKVYNQIKKDLFRDDDELAKTKLLKIKNCGGIEDIFTPGDFKQFVLKDSAAAINETNASYMKAKDASKIITALDFKLAVERGEVLLDEFSADTVNNIKSLVADITTRVTNDIGS